MATGTEVTSENLPAPTGESSFYRPELEILRFFAFFAIYLADSLPNDPAPYVRYHLPGSAAVLLATIASAGRFGFQLFFMLSGYLITSSLLRERWTRGDISIGAFYRRRILRIWPLYLVTLVLAAAWPWTGRLRIPYLLAYLLIVGNWMTVILGPPTSWASVLWGVSAVQQFYLFWPFAIKFLSRKGRLSAALAMVAVANVARYYLAVGALHPYSVFPNTLAELDSIGVGIVSAIALKATVPLLPKGKRLLLLYIGVVLLLGCGYFGRTQSPIFVIAGYPVVVVGCLALFIAFCGATFNWRPLVYLGKISYGLFLLHVVALTLVGSALGGRTGTPARVLTYWFGSLLVTIGLASASYHWLESPFLRRKEKLARYQGSSPVTLPSH